MHQYEEAMISFIRKGKYIEVERLIKSGLITSCPYDPTHDTASLSCINEKDDGRTLLHYAIEAGYEQITTLLLDALPEEVRKVVTDNGITTLMLAAKQGWFTITKRLIAAGVSVTAVSKDKTSALLLATEKGDLHVVTLLIDVILKSEGIRRDQLTNLPLFYDAEGNNPLHLAAKNGQHDLVYFFLQHPSLINTRNLKGETPLIVACKAQKFEICCRLIKDYHADVNIEDEKNWTCLYHAVNLNETNIVKLLLENGATCIATDPKLHPLQQAISNHASEIASLLMLYGAAIGQDFSVKNNNVTFKKARYCLFGTKIDGAAPTIARAITKIDDMKMKYLKLPNQEASVLECCQYALEEKTLDKKLAKEISVFIETRRKVSSLRTLLVSKLNEIKYFDKVLREPSAKMKLKRLPDDLKNLLSLTTEPISPPIIIIDPEEIPDFGERRIEQLKNLAANYQLLKNLNKIINQTQEKYNFWGGVGLGVATLIMIAGFFLSFYLVSLENTTAKTSAVFLFLMDIILLTGLIFLFTYDDDLIDISRESLPAEAVRKLDKITDWLANLITELDQAPYNSKYKVATIDKWRNLHRAHTNPSKKISKNLENIMQRFEQDKKLIHEEAMEGRFFSSFDKPLFFNMPTQQELRPSTRLPAAFVGANDIEKGSESSPLLHPL